MLIQILVETIKYPNRVRCVIRQTLSGKRSCERISRQVSDQNNKTREGENTYEWYQDRWEVKRRPQNAWFTKQYQETLRTNNAWTILRQVSGKRTTLKHVIHIQVPYKIQGYLSEKTLKILKRFQNSKMLGDFFYKIILIQSKW